MEFDPAEWRALAQSDPQEFERRRLALIEDLIASAPPDIQRRLRGTQFRVDMERGRASNPLSATLRISKLMWESFAELRTHLNDLAAGGAQPDQKGTLQASPQPAAAILPFRKPTTD